MNAEVIDHKDVSGKSLFYIRITNGDEKVIINIGEGTFKKLKDLENKVTKATNNQTKSK